MTRIRSVPSRVVRALVVALLVVLVAASPARSQEGAALGLSDFVGDVFGPGVDGLSTMPTSPNRIDNFTGGPALIDGPGIIAVGGGTFDAAEPGSDLFFIFQAYGLGDGAEPLPSPDSLEVVPPDIQTALMRLDILDLPPEYLADIVGYIFGGDETPIILEDVFDGSVLDDFPGLPPAFGDEYDEIIAGIPPPPPNLFGDSLFGPGSPLACGPHPPD